MAEASFGGSVPQQYDDRLVPLIFENYAQDIASRVNVSPGARILELACGTGVVTRCLINHLPEDVEIVATDVNPDMLAIAESKLAGAPNVTFRIEDATNLSFDDDSFDAVVCQFGIMFYPDKLAGHREAARILRPGGEYLFNVWDSLDRNPLFKLAHETLIQLFPDDPPGFFHIPFGTFNVEETRLSLHDAGWGEIEIGVLPETCRAESANHAAITFTTATPMAPLLEGRRKEAKEIFADAIGAVYGPGEIAAPMQAIRFVARG